ncbi:TnpV protein [uncultured Clostridium sp.]|uniref:TnpV protein n=1 Tax=uncultured Clostridium sp. TaxID=59620 RepID=UPI0025D508B1|nr:TnpV protein [uncultured Clostridium sp.]
MEMMMGPTEFSGCESTEAIADLIREKTLDKLEEETEFMEKYPNPFYAIMRLDYLVETPGKGCFDLLVDLYDEKKLIPHLMDVQERAIELMRIEEPRMMKAWNLTEEMKKENPQEYRQLMNNLQSVLREIAIKEVVEA